MKAIQKLFAEIIIVFLAFNPVLVPAFVYAQEVTPTETVSPVHNEPTQEPTHEQSQTTSPTPTPTPTTDSSSTAVTGDAAATGNSTIIANETEGTIPGDVAADTADCSVDATLGCSSEIANDATIESSMSATADTGENRTTNKLGDGTIITGDATAQSDAVRLINTNIITTTKADASESPTGTTGSAGEDGPEGPTGATGATLTIANDAKLTGTTLASSTTGDNQANENGRDAVISTGDAIAAANVANMINTVVIGSNIKVLFINIDEDQAQTINLYELWKLIEEQKQKQQSIQPAETPGVTIDIANNAITNDTVVAVSKTGNNEANDNGGAATIITGNAYAAANLLNIINTNIIGSNFFFVVINIFKNLTGDIVVPSREKFTQQSNELGPLTQPSEATTTITNDGTYTGSHASADANTGEVEEIGSTEQLVVTGNAIASAQTTTFMNMNIFYQNWMRILLNYFGLWNGNITGWNNPDETSSANHNEVADLQMAVDQIGTGDGEAGPNRVSPFSQSNGYTDLAITNTAALTHTVHAAADTGNNQANRNGGPSTIITGSAIAIANVVNFINTNLIGNRFFMPIINLFGSWTGNLAFAYPELQITINGPSEAVKPGDEVVYTVHYINKGYDDARNVLANVVIPSGVTYLSNSLGLPATLSGNTAGFPIGDVAPQDGGSFTITCRINPDIKPESQTDASWMMKIKHLLIKPAQAADQSMQVVVNAAIQTPDAERDTNDNSASVTTNVVIPDTTVPTIQSTATMPNLTMTNQTNVGEFVYPGDTVTFTMTISNNGSADATDVIAFEQIRDPIGNQLTVVPLNVGAIPSGKSARVSFGLTIPNGVPPGGYSAYNFAEGKSPTGEKITSQGSTTPFVVRLRGNGGIVEHIQAAEPEHPEALGVTTAPPPKQRLQLWMVIIPFLVLWLMEQSRNMRIKKEIAESLLVDTNTLRS